MGSLYRSEPMTLAQLFLQTDAAFASVAQLGELGLCQFTDLNPDVSSYARKYVTEVKRCDELERRIGYIGAELAKAGVEVPAAAGPVATPLPRDMGELEEKLERLEAELRLIGTATQALRDDYIKLSDIRHVLLKMRILFDEGQRTQAMQSIADAQHGLGGPLPSYTNGSSATSAPSELDKSVATTGGGGGASDLRFLAGVIRTGRVLAFERILWRMGHGKVFVRTLDIDEDGNAPFRDEEKKSAFMLFFSGGELQSKVRKICDAFHARLIDNCSESASARLELLRSIVSRLEDMGTVIGKTLEHHDRVLQAAAVNLKKWDIQVLKLKNIFATLNLFNMDVTQKCLIAECWIPEADLHRVRGALQYATEISGSNVSSILSELEPGHATPPTYHRLNKFTRGFQNIVDSYGIASYREINPAPWTIITFPFLFAVMFGDVGHGLVMLAAALALVVFERKIEAAKIKDEIFNTFYGGRYVILLMGSFALYTGFIYNDFFSKSLNIFGSSWRNPYSETFLLEQMALQREGKQVLLEFAPERAFLHEKGPYVFGLDPVWNVAANRLAYLNPMKMKGSIIIGISQMGFGLVLSLMNYLHRDSWLDVLFVFVPQMVFLSLIFVYLCVQVVLKWLFFWVQPGFVFGQYYPGPHCAPSLLIGLINMFMMKPRLAGFAHQSTSANTTEWLENEQCYLQLWYPGQGTVEMVFILTAVACIPVMLLVKPLVLWRRAKGGEPVDSGHGGDGAFNMADVMVYQAIHTIEFALGCISHTASYLRLWALSLAHAQLSDVLWTMVLNKGFALEGWPGAAADFVIFWVFAIMSVSVLVLMEGLSAFLHALRLHWVEFQSKFYQGAGVAFEGFSFEKLIRLHEGMDS